MFSPAALVPDVSSLSLSPRLSTLSVDPTDHGSNLAVVAVLAVGILLLIGLLVFLLTRRGRPR